MTSAVPPASIGLRFRVHHADGRSEQFVVDAERALVGSAAHCEVRLPAEAAAPEHVEAFVVDGRVHFGVRASDAAAPLLDGVPSSAGPWPPGAVLAIGATTLTADLVELVARPRRRSTLWLFAIMPVLAAATALLVTGARAAPEPPIPQAPPLFDAVVGACPMSAGDSLAPFAAEKLRLARAKRERGPFSPRDAVDAVPLFETAAACFRLAGADEDARDASYAAAMLRSKIDEEYRVRRVRLEHAYRAGDPFGAKRELAVLVPMTSQRPGAYQDWLGYLDRYATLEIERRNTRGLSP